MKRVALLGSTGSVGTQTLEVVRALNAREPQFEVVALAAGQNLPGLAEQVDEFRPEAVVIQNADDIEHLKGYIQSSSTDLTIGAGSHELDALVQDSGADLVVNGLVGAVGLRPTLAALEADIDVALANKESLVIGGPLVQRAREASGARLIPIDSEHSALFQLLDNSDNSPREDVESLILTASGGALRDVPLDKLSGVTPADVLNHPTWSMGARITVDSATLVNKGLEVIEAHWLFQRPYDRIHAVIHPQSVVHGMIELTDGGIRAALSPPDMREPIQYALTYPERVDRSIHHLDWSDLTLEFRQLDLRRYPAFGMVVDAGRAGGTAPAVANAADEVLVQRFLNHEIPFSRIASGIDEILQRHEPIAHFDLADLWDADDWAREQSRSVDPNG